MGMRQDGDQTCCCCAEDVDNDVAPDAANAASNWDPVRLGRARLAELVVVVVSAGLLRLGIGVVLVRVSAELSLRRV